MTAHHPFHLLAKPAGAACNLSCTYCFYLSKENLYPGDGYLMSEQTLECYLGQLFEATPSANVEVSWQGGEPMLRGMAFFERAVQIAERLKRPGQNVHHTIQTNGTLIDDEWACFFKANAFLVGVSIDGPPAMHDAYRVTPARSGSSAAVLRGWNALRRRDVDANVLCTIHAANQHSPLEVYRYLRDDLGARCIQLIPIVERATDQTIAIANSGWGGRKGKDRLLYSQVGSRVTDRSVSPQAFGEFLVAIFDEWVARDVGTVHVTTFDVALGSWLGQHNSCLASPTCGGSLAVEHNGDVYSCDHFVEPKHKLGNLHETDLASLVGSDRQSAFGKSKYTSLPACCKECPVLFACYGECPKNRFKQSPQGEPGLNYLCEGYKQFFTHIAEPMDKMARLLRAGRFADEIMDC